MSRLFNLESYPELCTHANLYETEILNSLAYKNSLDRHQEYGYRHDSLYPQSLTIQDELIPLKRLGVNLSEDGNNLYVIRDRLDSLSLRNFLNPGEKYIYRSVYHYWNYRQQIASNLNITNSLVVIDLGSMSDEAYCSLQFKQVPNSPYPIPIIDNRREIDRNFKLALNVKDIHDNIYQDLAQEILSCNFSQLAADKNTVEYLKSYLQKAEVFKIPQSQTELASFSIIVEIYSNSKVYYKSVSLDIALLEEIVINRIDIKAIAQFAKKHSEYSFVLISDYNFLPKFREAVLCSKIFVTTNHQAEFPRIWQEKQRLNFPLFGQYLDKIKFKIQRNKEIQWIEVLSTKEQDHIYYEGDPQTKHFVARIQETGQEYFTISSINTVLPIKINDRDYCINGNTQGYYILHPLATSETSIEELKIRIEFTIKLGSVPELKVTDKENKYKIEARLQDYVEPEIALDCIPLTTILEYRKQQFQTKITDADLCSQVTTFISSINKIYSFHQLPSISDRVRSANEKIRLHKRIYRTEPFLYINTNLKSLTDLKFAIDRFFNSGVIRAIANYFDDASDLTTKEKQSINNTINNVLNLIGRTHKLSEPHISQLLFSRQFIQKATKKIGSQYYTVLAKIALKQQFQVAYFDIFDLAFNNRQPCYQIEDYLWGYSRILLWYSEFYCQYQTWELDYLSHFKSITKHLLSDKIVASKDKPTRYQQDSFLALIYLLTFREANAQFCTIESDEYQLAKRVIEKYRESLVFLKAVPNCSLNECFEELLNGNSSQESVIGLVKAD